MAHQIALTVGAPIRAGELEAVEKLLDAMALDSAHNRLLPFGELPSTHFGRILIVELSPGVPTLLLMLDADAPLDARLAELVDLAGPGIDELYRHCEGYPSGAGLDRAARLRYLRSRMLSVDVFYVHAVGRTLVQVRQEKQLRAAIEDFLDRSASRLRGLAPLDVRREIQRFVQQEPALAWARSPAAGAGLAFELSEAVHKIGVPLILVALLPLLVPALLVWTAWLRAHELTDPPPSIPLDRRRLREISEQEDYYVHNAICTIADIKPGLFWRLTASLALNLVANYTSRHIFRSGSLAGLTTVHFARLMKVDHGRRVIFTSYYDGTLESYMDDFIDQIAWVLNTVFGNEAGFPTTRWLFDGGARNEIGFKSFLRGHQVPTPVWYSAYHELTAVNVDNNAQIRAGLYGAMNPAQAAEWLRRF
jgi:hypothetical protein